MIGKVKPRLLAETDPNHRRICLLNYLICAATNYDFRRKTDVIGVAMNYGKVIGAKREEFEALIDKPLKEIIALHPERRAKNRKQN